MHSEYNMVDPLTPEMVEKNHNMEPLSQGRSAGDMMATENLSKIRKKEQNKRYSRVRPVKLVHFKGSESYSCVAMAMLHTNR